MILEAQGDFTDFRFWTNRLIPFVLMHAVRVGERSDHLREHGQWLKTFADDLDDLRTEGSCSRKCRSLARGRDRRDDGRHRTESRRVTVFEQSPLKGYSAPPRTQGLRKSFGSGLDAAATKSVRAARPIVVAGATDPASRALAASLEASDYLVKPIELDDLAAPIKRRMAEA